MGVVNDAVVAHRGALVGEPGVIVVAGTGSMILAITDEGVEVESGQFEHYAGGARHLVFDVMHRILGGTVETLDDRLVAEILDYWQADDVSEPPSWPTNSPDSPAIASPSAGSRPRRLLTRA